MASNDLPEAANVNMLMGEHAHSIDAKGRIILPADFREKLGENFVLTKGHENCLYIYSKESWQELIKDLSEKKFSNPKVRAYERYFLAPARILECDKQGRFLVPGTLRKHAMLEKEVVLAGMLNHVEVWSKTEWERYNDSAMASIATESLDDIGV